MQKQSKVKVMTTIKMNELVINSKIDVPLWIDQGIEGCQVSSINQSGCASGAYMPAVTDYQAADTMAEHGDDVLEYIEEAYGELPQPNKVESWSSMAVFYLSYAVELWASQFEVVKDNL